MCPHIVMHGYAPPLLEGRWIIRNRARMKAIRNETPGYRHIAHLSPNIHSCIGGVQDGDVIYYNVASVMVRTRISINAYERRIVSSGSFTSEIQTLESQILH